MITIILEVKSYLKGIYGKFDIYITSVLKFFAALAMLVMINDTVGFMERLKNPAVVLIVALMCTFLPVGGIVLLCAVLILAHFYAVSLELTFLAFALFLIMFCLYIRFDTSDSYIILLVPLLFWIKLPYLAPLLVGLIGGVTSFIPVILGVAAHYLLTYVSQNAPSLSNSTVENMLEKVRLIIDGMIENKEMMLMVIAFSITVVLVYLIKSLSADYAWTIAIVVGMAANMIILLVGSISMDVGISILGVIVGSLFAAGLMFVMQYFIFSVDYSRTERVQFEDDDYVYYVKAVPKMSVTTQEVNVKRIHTQGGKKVERK